MLLRHGLLVAGCLLALGLVRSAAAQSAAPGAEQSPVPLEKIVLFNSGVGFFERGGKVTGDARLELKFKTEDINDLLKSMVLQDLGGGKISTVTYQSRDPVTRTLKTFAIDLTANPTLAQLLGQIRGERVELEAANPMTGVIVGIETRKEAVGKDQVVDKEYLNLLTDDGLRSVALESVGRIRLADPKLDAELRQALAVLALGHATDKKTVTLNFTGDGEREVRVGYIQESPIWKTSYRLVLDEKEKPFLQGWAIVENTTEEDWNDVGLTLVSGRPISFLMDLYQPLYVQRPLVKPELYASLGPVVYGQDMSRMNEEFRKRISDLQGQGQLIDKITTTIAPDSWDEAGGPGSVSPFPTNLKLQISQTQDVQEQAGAAGFGFGDRAAAPSVAQADNVGELFQYAIATPVDLPRQQSAMLPIVNESVEAEKLSIYNQSVQAKHPLNGLRLKNTTDLHLMQGPITVFDGGAYAGDAKIEDLQPGTERLVSYALDLDVEVAPESKTEPENLRTASIYKGTLRTQHDQTRQQKYVVKNSAKTPRELLIEYPYDANWTLVAPKDPKEKTRDQYRFAVKAEPGKPAELVIDEKRTIHQEFAITNFDDPTLFFYINAPQVSPKVKAALQEVVRRKAEIQQIANHRGQLEQQIQVISQEQERIRQNMAQLGRDTDLYRRYVKKFGEQEDQVEKLRSEIAKLQADETAKRQALDQHLIGLEVE
ncbi:MAG: hypothetical protein U0836_16600 [Pirellulales bacterium]